MPLIVQDHEKALMDVIAKLADACDRGNGMIFNSRMEIVFNLGFLILEMFFF